MNTLPLVSICCTTYNQKEYIRQAIESFLMQKTSFPIEIIIHDDASIDGTAEIVKSYAKLYPEIIIPILQQENQWSKGKRPSPNFVWPIARGKYVATCEGDDYWIDPLKLQKQVDFMTNNPNLSMCFHDVLIIWEGKIKNPRLLNGNYKGKSFFQTEDIIRRKPYISLGSMLFIKDYIQELPKWFYEIRAGEVMLQLLLSLKGDIGYIEDIMSVYRKCETGVSHNQSPELVFSIMNNVYSNFNEYTDKKYFHAIELAMKQKKIDLNTANRQKRYGNWFYVLNPLFTFRRIRNRLKSSF